MKEKKYFITTPIYYPSGSPHIGHCYTTIVCDVLARYRRAKGYDVIFLTGTDEHGQKIEDKAKTKGLTPKDYVDAISKEFINLWNYLNISYDRFVRTTDAYHIQTVQSIFKALYDKGYIYKGEYRGLYCKPCESFWTENQLKNGCCPDCGRPVEQACEEAYFFKLSLFADRLKKFLTESDVLVPSSRVNEMVNSFIEPGLEDICVSRTSFKWGIPVPFDDKHVVYVWIDALSNYISALGYQNDAYDDFHGYWPADVHVMAKEIVRFHSLIWPAILMALDLPLPKKIYGHGWIVFGGQKMSKSLGNVVDPYILGERYGVDALRYHILREMPFNGDSSFSNEIMLNRINADLANTLGNLLSRTTSMVQKYFGGQLIAQRENENIDNELISQLLQVASKFEENIESFHIQNAIIEVFKVLTKANKYIDETQPWILGKEDDKRQRLATVLYNLLEVLRVSSILLEPIMPNTMKEVQRRIGASNNGLDWDSGHKFGLLDPCVRVTVGNPLFPRYNVENELEYLQSIRKN